MSAKAAMRGGIALLRSRLVARLGRIVPPSVAQAAQDLDSYCDSGHRNLCEMDGKFSQADVAEIQKRLRAIKSNIGRRLKLLPSHPPAAESGR